MAIRVIFPKVDADIFGFPDSVRVTNRQLKELKRLKSFVDGVPPGLVNKTLIKLSDAGLAYVNGGNIKGGWYHISRLGARVLEAIEQGTFQSVG